MMLILDHRQCQFACVINHALDLGIRVLGLKRKYIRTRFDGAQLVKQQLLARKHYKVGCKIQLIRLDMLRDLTANT
jgi:hypothetical protein